MTSPPRDTIDLAEVLAVLRRGWRWIAAGALGGLALAIALTLLLRPRYEGVATVLLRAPQASGSPLAGVSGDLRAIGGLPGILSGSAEIETELGVLTSRSNIGAVVDSLSLQAIVLEPETTSPSSLFASAQWDPRAQEETYRFVRQGGRYRVSGPGFRGLATPGVPARVGRSTVTLRPGKLPAEIEIRLISREEAIDRFQERLAAEPANGDVAELVFRADDPLTAAAAPNALIDQYLERRRTVDRGVNQRRYEFLASHTDSIRLELSRAEQALRLQQERSGVLDPAASGEAELKQALELRAQLDATQVEARAFREVLSQAAAGRVSPRSLAAYPTFLGNEAINGILTRLQNLETERMSLLDRRTARDPDVLVIDGQIAQLENQLVSLSRSYLDGLTRRETQLRSELGRYGAVLSRLPSQAEAHYRLEREVRRLSETLIALKTQLVQARLAAIGEGGEVRQVDVAVPPDEPSFPRPLLNLVIGLFGGLMLGMVGALGSFYFGDNVVEARDAELASGVPAIRLDARMPLLLAGMDGRQSVLMIPVNSGESSLAAARRAAATAALQGADVVLADLEAPESRRLPASTSTEQGVTVARADQVLMDSLERADAGDGAGYPIYQGSANGGPGSAARAALEELERRFSLVVAALPPLGHPTTTAVLSAERAVVAVAAAGLVTRTELREMAGALHTAGIRLSGVVLRNGENGGDSGA